MSSLHFMRKAKGHFIATTSTHDHHIDLHHKPGKGWLAETLDGPRPGTQSLGVTRHLAAIAVISKAAKLAKLETSIYADTLRVMNMRGPL